MRAFHRILAIIASVFLLYFGVTGTLIQSLDLGAILSDAPETDLTMMSINEGQYGNRGYAVITNADFGAEALPPTLDYRATLTAALANFAARDPQRDPLFVELRVVDGAVVAQAGYGREEVLAFAPASNAAPTPTNLESMQPPPSARQSLKEWHRLWGASVPVGKGPAPAVYVELAVGVILLTMIGTGIVMYIRLLKQRRKLGRPALFWKAGGTWRMLHRAVTVVASIFLIMVAASGTLLGFESTWHSFGVRPPDVVPRPLGDDEVLAMADRTLALMGEQEQGVPIRVLRLRDYVGYNQGVVVTAEPVTRQIVFDTASGRQMMLDEPGYPDDRFPWGLDVHEAVKHFHSGFMFGVTQRLMVLLAGLALVYLSVSGIVMYFQMWAKRRAAGRAGFFWKG